MLPPGEGSNDANSLLEDDEPVPDSAIEMNEIAARNDPASAIQPLDDAIRHHIETALEKTLGRVEGSSVRPNRFDSFREPFDRK